MFFNRLLQAIFVGTILGASAFPEHSSAITIAIVLAIYLAVVEILSTLKTEKVSKESLNRLKLWDEEHAQSVQQLADLAARLAMTEAEIDKLHAAQGMKSII